jgi:hypothetical protein
VAVAKYVLGAWWVLAAVAVMGAVNAVWPAVDSTPTTEPTLNDFYTSESFETINCILYEA